MMEILFRMHDGVKMAYDGLVIYNGELYEDWRAFEDGIKSDNPLMQYTGLDDKNGVKIFEGDILKAENISYTGTYGYAVIKFGEYEDTDFVDDSGYCSSGVGFYATLTRTKGTVGIERYMVATMEVIGNIHDNPELVEVQNENP